MLSLLKIRARYGLFNVLKDVIHVCVFYELTEEGYCDPIIVELSFANLKIMANTTIF